MPGPVHGYYICCCSLLSLFGVRVEDNFSLWTAAAAIATVIVAVIAAVIDAVIAAVIVSVIADTAAAAGDYIPLVYLVGKTKP